MAATHLASTGTTTSDAESVLSRIEARALDVQARARRQAERATDDFVRGLETGYADGMDVILALIRSIRPAPALSVPSGRRSPHQPQERNQR